jgi:hydroxypyruvate isomerase
MSMGALRQSFAWWCVAQKAGDPAVFLRAVKAAGFAAVELLPRELWDAAREAGLVIATEGAGALDKGWNRRTQHAGLLEEVERKLELAGKYQIPNLIVFSGNRAGLDDEEGAETTAEGLRRAAPLAEAAGVTLVLELLNSKVDHIDYQCDHTSWGAKVIDAVGSPRVKLLYDIYHMQIMEGDIIRTIRENAARIGHVHTAGNPGRMDLDDEQELYYPPIIRALKECGYTGYLTHEFVPKGDALAALKAAYDLCNG